MEVDGFDPIQSSTQIRTLSPVSGVRQMRATLTLS